MDQKFETGDCVSLLVARSTVGVWRGSWGGGGGGAGMRDPFSYVIKYYLISLLKPNIIIVFIINIMGDLHHLERGGRGGARLGLVGGLRV